jgi:four helix bundle protein
MRCCGAAGGMSRDHRKLEVFQLADALVLRVYDATRRVPVEERYGIRSQIRRAAISTASNIVEGCARRTTREYLHFLNVASGSAAETRYLLHLATRLDLLSTSDDDSLCNDYHELLSKLQKLQQAIDRMSH